MTTITASMVKALREKTGTGMMDCKKALVENAGNLENAVDWLKKNGLASAAKKAGRTASEGLVAIKLDGTKGAIVELNSETDFVARNKNFQQFVQLLVEKQLDNTQEVDALNTQMAEDLTRMIVTIGENMTIRRATTLSVESGVVAGYIHNALVPNLGKIAVLVALESKADPKILNDLGKQISMHIAAARPEALSREDVDTSALERERQVLIDQAKASGKPDNIIEKMVEGRLRKYYSEIVLLEQVSLVDGERTIATILKDIEQETGSSVKITRFVRFELGEGIEKEETDFAAEVAASSGVAQ